MWTFALGRKSGIRRPSFHMTMYQTEALRKRIPARNLFDRVQPSGPNIVPPFFSKVMPGRPAGSRRKVEDLNDGH